jgi:hypothetical protein
VKDRVVLVWEGVPITLRDLGLSALLVAAFALLVISVYILAWWG